MIQFTVAGMEVSESDPTVVLLKGWTSVSPKPHAYGVVPVLKVKIEGPDAIRIGQTLAVIVAPLTTQAEIEALITDVMPGDTEHEF